MKNTGFQTTLDSIDFQYNTFFQISSSVFHRWKKGKVFFERFLFGWTIPLRSRKSSAIVVTEPKVFNCKIPPRYPKVRFDPRLPQETSTAVAVTWATSQVCTGRPKSGGRARGLVAALVQTSTKEMEVSVGRLFPGTGSTLWQRKEIQYWTFTKQQPARESMVLKHSNKLAHSHPNTVNIPIVRRWLWQD